MKKLLLFVAASTCGIALNAQNYITAASEGGFDVKTGKDYIVLYAPQNIIDLMGPKVVTNANLDPNQEKNTLEYWVTDWDKKDLTLYNVPATAGETNSFGSEEFINATPLYAWGTGVFIPRSQAYDLSKVTDEHHLHIGLRDFGSKPSKYQFAVGSQKSIKKNGFQIMVGIGIGQGSGDFVGVGTMPNGNDGKWYYLDIPVKDLVNPDGEFGFEYNFASPITDGVFTFSFNSPECSTAKKTGPAPGETVYTYEITKLGSALSLDHVFFYKPDKNGVENVAVDDEETVEAIYDLAGRRVENPRVGLYIVKTNLGTRKVYIK